MDIESCICNLIPGTGYVMDFVPFEDFTMTPCQVSVYGTTIKVVINIGLAYEQSAKESAILHAMSTFCMPISGIPGQPTVDFHFLNTARKQEILITAKLIFS